MILKIVLPLFGGKKKYRTRTIVCFLSFLDLIFIMDKKRNGAVVPWDHIIDIKSPK
jgi:hypothetical protein